MYAIIETGSKQYKVESGDIIDIELLPSKESVTFDKVLMLSKGNGDYQIGTPYIDKASVVAKVMSELKDKKVTSFKFKNKTNYHRTVGHRQRLLRVKIEEIRSE